MSDPTTEEGPPYEQGHTYNPGYEAENVRLREALAEAVRLIQWTLNTSVLTHGVAGALQAFEAEHRDER